MKIFALDFPPVLNRFDIASWFNKNLIDLGFQFSTKILSALLIILFTRYAIDLVARGTRRAFSPVEPTLRKFLVQDRKSVG